MEKFRSMVFKMAYEIHNSTGKKFADSLIDAWQIYRLMKAMQQGQVRFSYWRKDGKLRNAIGTLKDIEHLIKGKHIENYKSFRYYDIGVQGFRSFKVENLVTPYK